MVPLAAPATSLTSTVQTLVSENVHLVVPIVFALGFAESIAFVSLFVPSTALFLLIGAVHASAGGSFAAAALAGALGAFLGDIVSYGAGRYFKDDVARVWPFSRSPDLLPRGQAFFERWGALGVVGGKFLGMLRPFIPVVAGTLRMPWAIFLIASALSSLLWAGVFLAPGYGVTWLMR